MPRAPTLGGRSLCCRPLAPASPLRPPRAAMSASEAAAPSPAKSAEGGGGGEAPDADLPRALLKRILKARLSEWDAANGGDGTRDFQINKVRVGGLGWGQHRQRTAAPALPAGGRRLRRRHRALPARRRRRLLPALPLAAGRAAGVRGGCQAVHPLPGGHSQRLVPRRQAPGADCHCVQWRLHTSCGCKCLPRPTARLAPPSRRADHLCGRRGHGAGGH